MSERVKNETVGAVLYSPDADITGTPDNSVNLLDRFMALKSELEFLDLGVEGIATRDVRRTLIGGLALNLEDIAGYPKLDSLIEESIDRAQTYRKMLQVEPKPTHKMMEFLRKRNREAYEREMDRLQQERTSNATKLDDKRRARKNIEDSFAVFDTQEFKDKWEQLEDLKQRSNPGTF